MKQKFVSLLEIFTLLSAAKKQFKEFDNSIPSNVCDAEYISMFYRSKFTEHLEESAEHLWAIIGKLAKFDFDAFLPLAVEYFTNGEVVLEKDEEEKPNPNEEDAE